MKAYIEIIELKVNDVITTSGTPAGCGCEVEGDEF